MTTTMDNLEKLIQMATIEHMYSMLQKMKNETSTNFKECNFSDEKYSTENNALIGSLLNEIKNLKTEINDHTEKLRRNNAEIWQLSQKVKYVSDKTEQLENELSEIKNNTNNNSRFLCQQLRGQQTLTSYPGFSNGSSNEKQDEAHIKLKIEEKEQTSVDAGGKTESIKEVSEDESDEEEEEDDESEIGDDHPGLITCAAITLSQPVESVPPTEDKVVEETQELEESEEESEDDSEEESEEEESEEEVGTEDETESLEEVPKTTELTQSSDKTEETKPTEETEEVEETEETEETEEVEETDEVEEVFEIEIDDVTYFATHEENGILYEITSDGDVGKKVGIIKDGEPIFN